MKKLKLSDNYWENKILAYLHDPFDKAFCIPGHEERAQKLVYSFLGEHVSLEKGHYSIADGIASGFERGQLPSYSSDENKSGAIDFLKFSEITHPTSEEARLKLNLPEEILEKLNDKDNKAVADYITEEVKNYLKKLPYVGNNPEDIEKLNGKSGAMARFFLLHLALRFYLANNDVAGLGALWHKLPADTRFPNHSIWNHNAMVSAIKSCMEFGGGEENVGMMVFTITPVQKFIATARKLRDYWTGSVILSYLAFEGIKYVMENLGPDHILYPSLIDQPLVLSYLKNTWKIENINPSNKANSIASFPNKFLVLVPLNKSKEIAEGITEHIKNVWKDIATVVKQKIVKQKIEGIVDEKNMDFFHKIFDRQMVNYWDFHWASVKLVGKNDKSFFSNVLAEGSYERYPEILEKFSEILKELGYDKEYTNSGKGIMYSLTHQISQSLLAASKTKRMPRPNVEPGEKCHLCGEFEVLHHTPFKNVEDKARDYKNKTEKFWNYFWKNDKFSADFKDGEKLCAVCMTKRILYLALTSQKSVPDSLKDLQSVFSDEIKQYPMTTEMALHSFYERNQINDKQIKREIANRLFDNETDELSPKILKKEFKLEGTDEQLKIKTNDKYYAILMMDGDKMGDLINGETIASTWKSVMHSEMVKRFENKEFYPQIRRVWQEIFNNEKLNKMLLTPSTHSAISEALGDFAIYGVYSIVGKYGGKLIYAGGDDVAAVLPVENALKCANEIRKYYTSAYKYVDEKGNVCEIKQDENGKFLFDLNEKKGKLCYHLGKGEKISISAGILICHHKEALFEMIQRAHKLLDRAKDEGCRNAFAIELRKRSGGSRYFVAKWSDELIENFSKLEKAIHVIGMENQDAYTISTSLIYRLEQMKEGIEAILNGEFEFDRKKELLEKFFEKQISRSGIFNGNAQEFAKLMVKLTVDKNHYKPERLIIASFLAKGGVI